jgi:biopolymer transport protein ExbD
MGGFGKKSKPLPAISTASLPDIVFMLLFFFMVTTVLRETNIMVEQSFPSASQLQKIEEKSLTTYIFIGPPTKKLMAKFGKEPKIQVDDVFIESKDIPKFVVQERVKLGEGKKDGLIVSLKMHRDIKVGVVTDVKLKLRESEARNILYAARGGQ